MANRWVKQWDVKYLEGASLRMHKVSLDKHGDFACSCLAWTRKRIECRHIKMCKSGNDLEGYESKLVFDGTKFSPGDTEFNILDAISNTQNEETIKPFDPGKPKPTALDLIKQNAVYGGQL